MRNDASYPKRKSRFAIAAAIAGFLAVFVFRYNMSAEYSVIAPFYISYDYPHVHEINIIKWFDLLYHNPLIGLLSFNFFNIAHCALASMLYAFHIARNAGRKALRIGLIALAFAGSIGVALVDKSIRLSELSGSYYRAHHFEEKLPSLAEGRQIIAEMMDRFSSHNIGRNLAYAAFMGCGLWLAALLARKDRKHLLGAAANGLGLLSLAFYFALPGLSQAPGALYALGALAWHFMLSRDALRS